MGDSYDENKTFVKTKTKTFCRSLESAATWYNTSYDMNAVISHH